MKKVSVLLLLVLAVMIMPFFTASTAYADEGDELIAENTAEEKPEDDGSAKKAIAAAAVVGVVAAAGAISMAVAISKAAGSIARQPEAGGRINSLLMLGLVFIETAIIYALIVAILIIFVL